MLPSAFNLTTMLLFALTVWVIHTRYRTRVDNNWPLFYYIALVAYSRKFDQVLEPSYIFVTVICALLLRFEFLAGWVLKTVQFIETLGLAYVMVRCIVTAFGSR